MNPSRPRLLLASIHDVGPRAESQIDQLADLLGECLGTQRFAMLVVPDHGGEARLRAGTPFAARLRGWAEAGIEMFVHGWFHKDTAAHHGLAAIKARHMTAREGEFLGLNTAEAARRMAEGCALIEDITGRAPAGFVAPAWLYGAGALAALRASSFALAEDHMKVWVPQTGAVLARGPVVTWASRSPARTASSLAFAALARTALHPLPTVRVAVHPGDVTKPAILASIAVTLRRFAARRKVGRYAHLLE